MQRVGVDSHSVTHLEDGWELAGARAGEFPDAASIDGLRWGEAVVPGTVAAALEGIGIDDLDGCDWWFRTRFAAEPAASGEELVLALDGIATAYEVYLNGERILAGDSMFTGARADVGSLLHDENELAICCRALAPLLAVRRRPRARWRTKLVSDGNLRFFRTMLLGRAPGFAPGPAAVGPWRPVRLERRRDLIVEQLTIRSRLHGADGVLAMDGVLRGLSATPKGAMLCVGGEVGELAVTPAGEGWRVGGELRVPEVRRWWPHTHGEPHLYPVALRVRAGERDLSIDCGRAGFRELHHPAELERDGIALEVNGVPVFARGAVWTPVDLARPYSRGEPLRRVLQTVRDGGMNMLRLPGIGCYESEEFHDLCDALGILVWQDFMFANLDYPEQDPAFMESVEREGRELLQRIGGRPSLAVMCGGSEVAQQVAMLGLDPALASGPLYGELLPSLVAEAGVDAAFVPSAPWGGELPFRPNRGVANYYGVGAYLRPLEDVRRSEVRFAAECLAFSNVPDEEALEVFEAAGDLVVHHPRWKAGVPRDAGAGWDFEDVRDHYLRLLFGLDPVALRSVNHERYLELSRAVSGEMMAEVFGEWRRPSSPCSGGLVLWLRDLVPGAGWGVLDHRGEPKLAFDHLRRALAPVAVWSTDEGLGGVDVHVANDGPEPLRARLRIALYRDLEVRVEEVVQDLHLQGRDALSANLEGLVGRFVDAAWAYRFGPPAQDLIVLSVEQDGDDGSRLLSQAFRLPAGRPAYAEPAERFGAVVRLRGGGGGAALAISARRFLYGVRVHVPGFRAREQGFSVEPGHERVVELAAQEPGVQFGRGSVSALNVSGRIPVQREGEA